MQSYMETVMIQEISVHYYGDLEWSDDDDA